MTEPDAPMPEVAADAEPAPTGSAPRGPWKGWPLVAGLAVVVAVLAGALALGRGGDVDDLTSAADARKEVARVAAAFGEAYLSYDFDDVDGGGKVVTALTTAEFAKAFEDTRAPGIEELFSNLKTSTKASTQEVFVGEVNDATARALVVVDVEASSTSSGDQLLSNLSFVLDLVHVDGEWKVDKVAPAPQPDIADVGGTAPTTTTTTTAPPAP